jgi:hypothetical protein
MMLEAGSLTILLYGVGEEGGAPLLRLKVLDCTGETGDPEILSPQTRLVRLVAGRGAQIFMRFIDLS